MMGRIFIDEVPKFKKGDPPPVGYCAWHEWARVQMRAGLKQKTCGVCRKLNFPQELSRRRFKESTVDANEKVHKTTLSMCKACAAKYSAKGPTK